MMTRDSTVSGSGSRRASAATLPDFCAAQSVLRLLLIGALLGILLALASPAPVAGIAERVGPQVLLVELVVLSGAGLLCLVRARLARLGAASAAVVVWLLLMLVTAVVSWLAYLALPMHSAWLFPEDGMVGFLLRTLGICAIVAALLLRHLYLYLLWQGQVQAEADARFRALQARIRPHFLFNSINTIASLTHTDPTLAEELLQDLADLFRAAFARERDRATLADELLLVRRYLHIERHRLGEQLIVRWDVDELPQAAPLPPLLLQPLVENAVYHGIQPARRPGVVTIVGRYRRGQVNLSVRNTLPEVRGPERHARGNRVALDNVRQRLELMYPGVARVMKSHIEGDYQVRLTFPYPWSGS